MTSQASELDWDDLRYFLRAMQAGSLAAAARSSSVEHTTIGRHLDALERVLGVSLVVRRPEGLALTPLGERTLPLVMEVERAVNAVRDFVTAQRSRVRVAVPTGLSHLLLPELPRLHKDHPDISVEILSSSAPVDLGRGEADLAVRIGPVDDKELVARRVADSGSSLYASPQYLSRHPAPTDPKQLAGHQLIGYPPTATMPAARWIEEHAAGATIVVRCREMTEMVAAVSSGVGIAMLGCWAAERQPGLVRLFDQVLTTRPIYVVYRRDALTAVATKATVRFVTEVLRENATALAGEVRRAPTPPV